MNKQREVIYGLRNEMLDHGDPTEEVESWLEELVARRVAHFTGGDRNHPDTWNLSGLHDDLGFLLHRPVEPGSVGDEHASYEAIEDAGCTQALEEFRSRVAMYGGEPFLEVVRHVILFTIDDKWRDHLYELDQLKHGIGLRAYGQKDPLLEYKAEAFKMFEQLVSEIEEESVRRVFRIEPAAPPPPVSTTTVRMIESKPEAASVFSGGTSGGGVAVAEGDGPAPMAPAGMPAAAPAPRRAPVTLRAGRNDPCPCGSGKKYKKCHLPIDEGSA